MIYSGENGRGITKQALLENEPDCHIKVQS
jgi:hypothetical protein